MRTQTVLGLLVGGAVALVGGLAFARTKSTASNRPPYFEYRVQEGDTLTALGLRFFGDAKQWPAMMSGQGATIDESALRVGLVLRVPCLWHVVQPGDTLSKIAGMYLRNPGRWQRVYEANRASIPDKDRLAKGQILAVPLSGAVSANVPAQAESIQVGGLDCLGAATC